jgi:RHS repeat-associated protein
VTARNVPGDSFGAEAGDLTGAAIDKVAIKATRGTDGTLTSVEVTVRSTEALTASTVATGVRLTTVDNAGAVVRTASVTPVLSDPFTARFTLTAAQWTALTDPTPLTPTSPGPQSLSIGVTNTLRAAAWSQSLPLLPPPEWAKATKPVYSTATLPVEVRESLTSLATFTATGATTPSSTSQDRTLYEIDSLTLAATPAGGGTGNAAGTTLDAASARFQALPFVEPMTGLIYARNRWYDPKTGSWLSPDPLGYQDSANLYAFCGGDPVNCSDPTGEAGWDPAAWGHWIDAQAKTVKRKIGAASIAVSAHTGVGAVDSYVNMQVAGAEATLNSALDFASGIPVGLLTIGEGSGTAIAEEGCHDVYSCGMTGSAIVGDAAATVLYGVGIAGAAESRISGLRGRGLPRTVATPAATADAGEAVAARGSYKGRARFDASNLTTEQVDKAILKSIRRKSGATGTSTGEIAASANQTEFVLQKVTAWRRNVHAGNSNLSSLPANVKGTLLHSSVQSRISQLNIRELAVNQRIYGTSQFTSPNTGLPYEYRIPDFRSPTAIFDIKPWGTPLAGPQYLDFRQFSGLSDIRWIYYLPY